MPFLTPVPLHPVDTDRWLLLDDAVYQTRAGERITLPRGFVSNLASVPQPLQWIVPVNGRHRAGAILHDLGFVLQDRPRDQVDLLFLQAMEDLGVRATQRWAMYAAVRVGGWRPWRYNARQRADDLDAFLAQYNLGPQALSVNDYIDAHFQGLAAPRA